jgi:hypothetical protein
VQLRSIYQSNHTTNTTTKYTNLVPFRANSLSLTLTHSHSLSLTDSECVGRNYTKQFPATQVLEYEKEKNLRSQDYNEGTGTHAVDGGERET